MLTPQFPMTGLRVLRQEMDELFDDWARETMPMRTDGDFRRQIDVVENDDELLSDPAALAAV